MRWWVALLVVVTVGVFTAPANGAAVRVVVRTPRPIHEIAAAGDRVAWIEFGACRAGVSFSVFRLNLRTHHQARLTSCFAPREAPGAFALAGTRTMWEQTFEYRHKTVSTLLTAARLGDKRVVASLRAIGCGGDGCNQGLSGLKVLDGVVSGGNRLFYGVLDVAAGPTCSGGVCDEIHTGGRVRRLTSRGPVTVPGAPAPAMFAARGRRLADVPMILGTSSFDPSHSVDILNAITGTPVATLTVADDIQSIALSRYVLGVLTQTAGGGYEVRRYTSAGTLLGTTPVTLPRISPYYLLATGTKLLFRTDRGLFMMNAITGVYRRIYLARAPSFGPTLAGPRVVWTSLASWAAEHTIFELPLPSTP